MGLKRVFYRAPTNRALEQARESKTLSIITSVQRHCRGGIARGVRKRLAAARAELAAAVEKKELTALDAALEKV